MFQKPLTNEQVECYRRDGYLVVPKLVLIKEIAVFLKDEKKSSNVDHVPLQRHKTDPAYSALASHPKIVAIVSQLLEGHPNIVQTMFLNKPKQGGRGIALHQDTHYLPNEPNTLMACWIALSDTDADNGGLCVVPGSHMEGLREAGRIENKTEFDSWETEHEMRDPDSREWKRKMNSFQIQGLPEERIMRLSVPKGSGVFFTGMTIHGSFANHSEDRPRQAFATHYIHESTWLHRCDVQNTVPA